MAFVWMALLSGCDTADPAPGADTPRPGTPTILVPIQRGYSLSPNGFPENYSQIEAFWSEVQALGRGSVQANMLWRDDVAAGTDAGTIPAVAQVAAAQDKLRDVTLTVVFGWRQGENVRLAVPANPANDWTNEEAVAAFASMAAAYASANRPEYLFIGNETDFYAEQDAADYLRWTAAYRTIRSEIKRASPSTLVGTVFNVEHMMGTGRFSGWTLPVPEAWILHDASTIDVVGLTLYPHLGTATPAELPASYLDGVKALIGDKPVVVTETGWPADASDGQSSGPTPWTPGEAEQEVFVERLAAMLSGMEVRVVNWLFLHPLTSGASPSVIRTFGSISGRREDGAERPVYATWQAFDVPVAR